MQHFFEFQTNLLGMLEAESIVYLLYINVRCSDKLRTKQLMLGLTMIVKALMLLRESRLSLP